MTIKTILGEVAFLGLALVILSNVVRHTDGIGQAVLIVLIAGFVGFGSCRRLTHPG